MSIINFDEEMGKVIQEQARIQRRRIYWNFMGFFISGVCMGATLFIFIDYLLYK